MSNLVIEDGMVSVEKKDDTGEWIGWVDIDELIAELSKYSKNKKWQQVYSLESITDFYADDHFEDAIREVIDGNEDLSQEIRITVELVK